MRNSATISQRTLEMSWAGSGTLMTINDCRPTGEILVTKSAYAKGFQCFKLVWHYFNTPETFPIYDSSEHFAFDQTDKVRKIGRLLFPDGIEADREHCSFEEQTQTTLDILSLRKTVFDGAFSAHGARCRIDILSPHGPDKWDVIEVLSSTSWTDIHLHDVGFQAWLLVEAGLKINKVFLMHINSDYVRVGDIDTRGFFRTVDVTNLISAIEGDVRAKFSAVGKVRNLPVPPEIAIGPHCEAPHPCPLHDACWKFLPGENVLTLYRGKKKGFDLLANGVQRLAEIPSNFKLTHSQQIQRRVAINGKPHVDRVSIRSFLRCLCYPIHFLDFETLWTAIPPFDDVRPYEQIPFQFSLHILSELDALPTQQMFLAEGKSDPRPEFLAKLRESVEEAGSIVAYNANFETARLRECCESFPEFLPWLDGLESRFVDLLLPFRSFHYYHPKQFGSASMKAILPAMTGLRYDHLAIQEGVMASSEFLRITYTEVDEKERQRVRRELEQYCSQDTVGMISILKSLHNLAEFEPIRPDATLGL